jgi:protein SCO1/2
VDRGAGTAQVRRRRVAATVLVALGFLLAACGGGSEQVASLAPADASGLRGVRPDAPYPRPAFTLTDTSGAPYDFTARTGGRATILFFGYTECPDECPTAMADVASALRKAPEMRDRVSVVFVTTVPKRDSPRVIRRWLDRFDESFVGLTGTPEQLTAAQLAAHVPPAKDTPGGPDGYTVAHSSLLLGYGANDRARVVYPPGAKVSDIAADLHLLAEKDPAT